MSKKNKRRGPGKGSGKGSGTRATGRVSAMAGAIPAIVDPLPGTPEACLRLGQELEHRREFDRACRAFGRAVKLAPRDARAHAHHGYALGRTLAMAQAAAAHDKARRLAPDDAWVVARHGQMLMDNDMDAEAVVVLTQAVSMDPECGDAHMNLCWALRRSGQTADAIRHGRIACRTTRDADAPFYLAFALMANDEVEEALEVCRAMLNTDPHSVPALSLMVSALERCGHRDAGRQLADFDTLVVNADLKAPPGYQDVAAFNADLARIIESAPARPLDPTQTLDIFERPEGAIYSLWQVFNQAAQQYFAMLPRETSHPFLASRPSQWVLDGWGNRVRGNPAQEHHFHHHGWLSGVYYVEVPEFVNRADAGVEGCIEFCRFNSFSSTPVESEFMVLRPQAGTLALFPSYVYHRVCEYSGNDRRISIAFNLTPTAWQA